MSDPMIPADAHPGGVFSLAGREVARVGHGTMQLPRLKDPGAARKVLRRAFELGVRHFDTADAYADGSANDYLAEELGREQDLVIVTKVGVRPAARGPMPMVPAQRPEELRRAVLDNLRSLRTDHLSVVNLRRIAPGSFPSARAQKVDFDDQLAAMVAMRDEGLIGAVGLSSVSLDELRRALPAGIACVQNPYSLTARKDEPMLDVCRTEHIAWVPYFPLGGAFPGLVKVTHQPVVQEIADVLSVTPAQVGLAWLLHHAPNILLIPGTSSVSHLEQNVAAGAVRLDSGAMARLDEVKPVGGLRGSINRLRRP